MGSCFSFLYFWNMEVLILAICALIILLAFLFSIIPPLPGPPIAVLAMGLLHYWHPAGFFTQNSIIIWALLSIAVVVFDAVVPPIGTKKFGGSKAGVRGSIVGLILGMIFGGPLGILIGPFLGAVGGELITGKDINVALKSGVGSFLGFLLGVGVKLMFVSYITYLIVTTIW